MRYEEQRPHLRHELAARLRQLADQWDHGEIVYGDVRAAVPELSELALTFCVDESEARLDVKLRWPLAAARRLV